MCLDASVSKCSAMRRGGISDGLQRLIAQGNGGGSGWGELVVWERQWTYDLRSHGDVFVTESKGGVVLWCGMAKAGYNKRCGGSRV